MKDRRKTIRMSKEEEKRVLLSLEDTGLNFSDYVRKAINDHPVIVISGSEIYTCGCKNWEQSKSADNACS